ncbi:MAG: hypothetical protein KJZ79_07975 [Bryobacteraceae bacterium]|nr:hypothetical protein [Bryobacteraceae bacterium]
MAGPVASWVPFEWPESWAEPALLRLLAGSPFNCLLVPPSLPSIRAAAEAAGIICPNSPRWHSWRELDWTSPGELAAISDGFWPELAQKGGDSELAGPTGAPWLDANGWLIEMARARAPQSTIWLRSDLPEDPRTLRWQHYQLALLEAWAYGARRPLALAAPHAEALARNIPEARQSFDALLAALRWMSERPGWPSFQPFARLAIASDFTGPNEYISTETLLLAARLGIAFVPLDRARLNPSDLSPFKALLWCDPTPVPAEVRPWVEKGGTLIAMPPALKDWRTGSAQDAATPRFRIHGAGNGRIAVAHNEFDDPWLLARDAHLLMSRRHDALRLFNAPALQTRHAHSQHRHVLHLLNYTLRPAAHPVVLQLALPAIAARVHLPGHPPAELPLRREIGGLEAQLPPFPIYAAVEFEVQATPHADA